MCRKKTGIIVIDPSGLKQLLSQTSTPRLNSADYNKVKALVKGEIDYFAGFYLASIDVVSESGL